MKHAFWGCLFLSYFFPYYYISAHENLASSMIKRDAKDFPTIDQVVQCSMNMWTKIDLMKRDSFNVEEAECSIVLLIDDLLSIYHRIEELKNEGQLLVSDEYTHVSSILEHIKNIFTNCITIPRVIDLPYFAT